MVEVTFNTGRQYTDEGQRITVRVHDDGTTLFKDHSRMVYGVLNKKYSKATGSLQAFVMREYDLGEIHFDCPSDLYQEAKNLTR